MTRRARLWGGDAPRSELSRPPKEEQHRSGLRGTALRRAETWGWASRLCRSARFTDAQNDGYPTGDRFERDRIKTTDDLAHVVGTDGLRPIDNYERQLLQAILQRRCYGQAQIRLGMCGRHEGDHHMA
jgi:hypothetical protein